MFLIVLLILFNNIIFNKINLPDFFNYWDEIFTLVVILYGLLKGKFSKKISNKSLKIIKVNYVILFFIVCLSLLSNVIFNFAFNYEAVFRDIVNFLKFPLTLIIFMSIGIKNKELKSIDEENMKKKYIFIEDFCKFYLFIIFICAIVSLFFDLGMSQNEIRYGIRPFQFLYSHPTYLVLTCIYLLSIFEVNVKNKNIFIYRMMVLIIILLTMRTKGIMFVSLYIFITYFGDFFKKNKFVFFVLGFGVVFASAYSKLMLYNSFSTSPREVLYKGCIQLLIHCFPLGSGFGTFASHISAQYFSNAYHFINIPQYYLMSNANLVVFGDAGYPYYIAQFGLIGILLLVKFFKNVYILLKNEVNNFKSVMIIFIYILIALTSESLLLNCGMELALLIYYISFIKIQKSDK